MNSSRAGKVIVKFLLATALLASCWGCGRSVASLDARDEQDPMMRRALEKKRVNDIDAAIDLYQKALDKKPYLARAHLELGLIYDGTKQDYLRAIYHYQRYLELRPDTEKRGLIEDLIRRAKLSYAASLPETPDGAIEEIASLKQENEMLRKRIVDLMSGNGQPPPKKTTTKSTATSLKPAPVQPSIQTYRVHEGDTLTRIATKVYNDPKQWIKIFEANRELLGKPENIRVGQTLVIPK